jgi:hypothetical protein
LFSSCNEDAQCTFRWRTCEMRQCNATTLTCR